MDPTITCELGSSHGTRAKREGFEELMGIALEHVLKVTRPRQTPTSDAGSGVHVARERPEGAWKRTIHR